MNISTSSESSRNAEHLADTMLQQLSTKFMASPANEKGDSSLPRPRPLHVSKSFSRLEPNPTSPSVRGRASTIQNGTMMENETAEGESTPVETRKPRGLSGVFARVGSFGIGERDGQRVSIPEEGSGKLPGDFDDLPVELVSLTDRYVTLCWCPN